MKSLRAEWDSNASGWTAWASSPERDHAFWCERPAFLHVRARLAA